MFVFYLSTIFLGLASLIVQVERMRAAGVEQETGIVTSLKKGEYGFIRAATRKDEVYFRVDDVYEMGDNVLNEVSCCR